MTQGNDAETLKQLEKLLRGGVAQLLQMTEGFKTVVGGGGGKQNLVDAGQALAHDLPSLLADLARVSIGAHEKLSKVHRHHLDKIADELSGTGASKKHRIRLRASTVAGAAVALKFRMKNPGPNDLTVSFTHPTLTCDQAPLPATTRFEGHTTIPGNQEGHFILHVTVGSGATAATYEGTFHVIGDDRLLGSASIILVVQAPVVPTPPISHASAKVGDKTAKSQSFTLHNPSSATAVVTLASPVKLGPILATLRPVDLPNNEIPGGNTGRLAIQISADPGFAQGTHTARVAILLDGEVVEHRELTLGVGP